VITDRLSQDLNGKKKRVRPLLLLIIAGLAVFIGWLAWPRGSSDSPFELSRADGRPRFYATEYSTPSPPPNLGVVQSLYWNWAQFRNRRAARNPATYTFPPRPVDYCFIHEPLRRCTEISGTTYLIAVEISGMIQFGHTNTINGSQWVDAFERAITNAGPVLCQDFKTKQTFYDTLLLIREVPRTVKVVPRTKLAEYQRAGLVKRGSLQ